MDKKLIVVVGMESSGSRTISTAIGNALKMNTKNWDGTDKFTDYHTIYHRSIPFGHKGDIPDVKAILEEYPNHDKYIVLTTRDKNISETSRLKKYILKRGRQQILEETLIAQELSKYILENFDKVFIWSYETFLLLEDVYLQKLYKFLSIKSDHMPKLKDGNKKYIES